MAAPRDKKAAGKTYMEKSTMQEQNFLSSGQIIIAITRHRGKTGYDPALQRQVAMKKKVLAGATILLDLAGEDARVEYRRVLRGFLADPLFLSMPSPTRDCDMKVLRIMARIGAAWFKNADTDKTVAAKVNALLDTFLTRPADRALFGLH